MNDLIRSYGSLALAIVTVIVSLITQWAVFGVRLGTVEARQDRQATAIMLLQDKQTEQTAANAALKEKLDGVADNVSYIRTRVDALTK